MPRNDIVRDSISSISIEMSKSLRPRESSGNFVVDFSQPIDNIPICSRTLLDDGERAPRS